MKTKLPPSMQKKHTFFAQSMLSESDFLRPKSSFLQNVKKNISASQKIFVSTIFLFAWDSLAISVVFTVWFGVQGTAPARYSVPAPGVKLKLRPRDGTTDTCCPSTPHVLRFLWKWWAPTWFGDSKIANLLGEAWIEPMSGQTPNKSSIEMSRLDKQIQLSLVLCKMCQDVFFAQFTNIFGYEPHILSSHSQWTMRPLPVLDLLVPNVVPGSRLSPRDWRVKS